MSSHTWHPSPNFQAMKGRPITCIVVHATATKSLASPLEWLCNPDSKVSAHYLIDITGDVFQLVRDMDIAWHAGKSEYAGTKGVNGFSLGVELVNPNDGQTPYPEDQMKALRGLLREKMAQYHIVPAAIVGHLEVSPSRKTDPAGLDLDALRKEISI